MKSSKLQKFVVFYNNSQEYHLLKKEIFTQDLYHFETSAAQPIIIDAGAHIGISTLYFKQLYPGAKIIAIEPNPQSFKLLERNIFENQLDDITTIQAALSDHSGEITLYLDETAEEWHSVASIHYGSWVGTQKSKEIVVQAFSLSEFVNQPIDFLKMDIEAAEQNVLMSSPESMPLIKQMIIEFHSHKSQSLQMMVDFLERTHRVRLYQGTKEVPSIKKARGLVMIVADRK